MGKRILKYELGQQIIKRGDMDQRMYIILDGTVEISMNDGMKKVILSTLGRREFFGEISLFIRAPRTADVHASAVTRLTYLDSVEELDAFLKKNHSYSNKMVKVLAQRIASTNTLLLDELGGKKCSTYVGWSW